MAALDIDNLIKIAETTASRAGSYLTQKLGSSKIEHQKSLRDDLLDADLEAERLILTKLRQETPNLGILSEEAGQEGTRDHYWIVDPLDGSANFQHGSPLFGVAIALVINQVTVGSVIYLPKADEMFVAIQGQGAFLNGTRIKVSQIAALDKAIVHIGDFAKDDEHKIIAERLKDLSKLATRVQRIRMIGTAAADLAYVACGRADMLIDHTTNPWDAEAGKLLVLEAGGKATTKQYLNGEVVNIYGNKIIHQAAEDLLLSQES
jgi:myo-inositol-1(or 4)-monophosphatase